MLLKDIKGIGEKTEKVFNRAGVYQAEDLLDYYPRYYDTYEAPVKVRDLEANMTQTVKGTIVRECTIRRVKNLVILDAYIRDEDGGAIKATWFNAPYLKNQLQVGSIFCFRGYVKPLNTQLIMDQPKIFTESLYASKMGEMQPVYPLVRGLTNNQVIKATKDALEKLDRKEDIPKSVREKYNLEDAKSAYYKIHFPGNYKEFNKARKRVVFGEFFNFITNMHNLKDDNEKIVNEHIIEVDDRVDKLIDNLPFKLTNAQLKTWNEIKDDLKSNRVMNRLIQGDVGSGKTIVATLALIATALNGYQGAIMAPTEVLATQHYESFIDLFDKNNLDLNVVLLVGSMTAKEKREAYALIESGEADIIVGTHALIQDKVNYNDLGIVITDEQHRFGVKQRETISKKGNNPHIMVMSATPIPRTLAIIMYGDLDISIIDELPANRLPRANCVVDTSYRPKAYSFIEEQINQGRQAYIICPSVEYSEAMEGENVIEYSEKLKKILPPNIKVEYLHGRMKPAEKNDIMERFSEGSIHVLVSTTVVEVGVNVPNATVMMVENAERFGLAQLHQLRGRVGRGKHQSYCIFVNGSKDENKNNRLEVLCKSNDGFKIANEDLMARGPGDFFGVRQSGDFEFRMGDIMNDADMLKMAKDAFDDVIENKLPLTDEEHKMMFERKDFNMNI